MTISKEMSKKDIIETILFILKQILDYTSKLKETIPSVFDKKEKEDKNALSDLSTCQSDSLSDKENDNCTEEKYTIDELINYWIEKLNFNEDMLYLMMMNLDKLLNSKKIILNDKNVENILFTCMVITQKYYEDVIFSDKDYSKLKNIEYDDLINMQMDFLETINYSLLINKDDLEQYKIKMKRVWKKNMLFLLNSWMGIKKIIELYEALSRVEKGDIVFIDEFDANLHDVLLMKIVEYILNYSKGQFIFTIHNMAPMDLLQYKKHGIDFLSPDSRIVPWAKNGNYKAASLYRQGFIEYSPFNIEAFSFLGKFGDDN